MLAATWSFISILTYLHILWDPIRPIGSTRLAAISDIDVTNNAVANIGVPLPRPLPIYPKNTNGDNNEEGVPSDNKAAPPSNNDKAGSGGGNDGGNAPCDKQKSHEVKGQINELMLP